MIRRIRGCRRRGFSLFLCVIMIFSLLVIRVAHIQNSSIKNVADMQFTRTVQLGNTRGYIYDRNYRPLVNENKTEKTVYISYMCNIGTENEIELHNGICMLSDSTDEEDSEYLKNFYTVERYSEEALCVHIIGYTDINSDGVSGIEKAYNRILKEADGSLSVSYKADASGYALPGGGLELEDNNYDSPAGLVLTIDKEIQSIAEKAIEASSITCGAVVVMDVNTFEILASVSVPSFDYGNLEASLNNSDRPFFNRVLGAYPVGSVFKPIIAVAALENSVSPESEFDCKGYYKTGSNTFRCYNGNVHGKEDLNSAIQNSCNSYFIDLALKTGKENVCETVSLFGFGKEIVLCSGLTADGGNFPAADEISSDSELANLSFGQGQLLASPVQIAAAYSVLANGGHYREPVILKELIDDTGNVYAYYKSETEYEVCSQKTCDTVNTCLYNNMLNGTGTTGAPSFVSSAGKTATAQTGIFDEEGKEQLCTWFAGFFPYEEPEYAVVVFNENGSIASEDCAPVFKEIADSIMLYVD